MHWVRRNSRFGLWAAMFALAIQLVLSFGHVHLEDIPGSTPTVALQPQPNGADSTGPADADRGTPRRDFCAICAALSLTSNSVLPAVSLHTTPVDHLHEWAADFCTAQVSFGLHFHFQARAPPHTI
jgi:hypothetical protein